MDEIIRRYHEVANIFPLLTGDVKATVHTNGHTHIVYLSPSVHKGYYYISVIALPASGCEYTKRPLKIEYIGIALNEMGVDTTAVRWRIESCKPYATSPDEIKDRPMKTSDPIVYFIEGDGKIKIGVAQYVESRLRVLQAGSPVPLKILAVCPGGYERESELHKRFADTRLYGEWFEASEDLMDFIQDMQ